MHFLNRHPDDFFVLIDVRERAALEVETDLKLKVVELPKDEARIDQRCFFPLDLIESLHFGECQSLAELEDCRLAAHVISLLPAYPVAQHETQQACQKDSY